MTPSGAGRRGFRGWAAGEETLTHESLSLCYNKSSNRIKKGVYLARPFLINLAYEGGQMSYFILTDSPTKKQLNNAAVLS